MGRVEGVLEVWGEKKLEDLALGGNPEHPSSLDSENDK
jgi:hypothetical protein